MPARRRRAYSMVELLVCVVIVAILSTISLVTYWAAVDNADLKFCVPQLARTLQDLQKRAYDNQSVITVTFELGTQKWSYVERKNGESSSSGQVANLLDSTLLKRGHKFRRYEWPDGSTSPATMTFFPTSSIQGGTLYIGTSRAEGSIKAQDRWVLSSIR